MACFSVHERAGGQVAPCPVVSPSRWPGPEAGQTDETISVNTLDYQIVIEYYGDSGRATGVG
jgi:hypothetical protein